MTADVEQLKAAIGVAAIEADAALERWTANDAHLTELRQALAEAEGAAPPPYAFDWQAAQLVGSTRARGRVLSITLVFNGGEWLPLAIETDKANANNMEAILNSHGHKVIGHFTEPAKALEAVDAYARAWFAGDEGAMIAACSCSDIVAL